MVSPEGLLNEADALRYGCGVHAPFDLLTIEGELKVRFGEDAAQLAYQEALGKELSRCIPEISVHEISKTATREQLYELCASVLREALGIRIRMVSFGPTEKDKTCK